MRINRGDLDFQFCRTNPLSHTFGSTSDIKRFSSNKIGMLHSLSKVLYKSSLFYIFVCSALTIVYNPWMLTSDPVMLTTIWKNTLLAYSVIC